MPRSPRTDVGYIPYHVLNRANARLPIFTTDADYLAFERVLGEAQQRSQMRILTHCIMPNHWHLVLYPPADGMLVSFMRWLTMTHTQRWHAAHETTGTGHIYQGRYKSFPIETDAHLLQVCRYVERNPVRARLVARAEAWRWSGLWRRVHGSAADRALHNAWPVPAGERYLEWVNEPEPPPLLEELRTSVARGRPFGSLEWTEHAVRAFHLAATVRSPGRPSHRNGS